MTRRTDQEGREPAHSTFSGSGDERWDVQMALLFTHVDFFEPYGIWYAGCDLGNPGVEPTCRKPEPYAAFAESVA